VCSTCVYNNFLVFFLYSVKVYDATNGRRERREWLLNILSKQNGFKVMFVESVCTDADIVDGNIRVCFILICCIFNSLQYGTCMVYTKCLMTHHMYNNVNKQKISKKNY